MNNRVNPMKWIGEQDISSNSKFNLPGFRMYQQRYVTSGKCHVVQVLNLDVV
jgi:hypothetical protein